VNIIYNGKRSPDVDTEPVISNVEHCLTLPMPATARVTEERIPSEQDSNSECAPSPQESQHPGVAWGESDNDVGDFVRHGKQSWPSDTGLELVESNVEHCLASSVQSVPTEAWTTQRIKVLWSKQDYNGEHFPIHQESRTPVIAWRDQDDDVEDIVRHGKQTRPPNLGPQTVKTNSGDLILSESPLHLATWVINELTNPAIEPVLDGFGYVVVRRGKWGRPPDSKLETWTNDKHLRQSEMSARDSPHNVSVTHLDDKAKCCLATRDNNAKRDDVAENQLVQVLRSACNHTLNERFHLTVSAAYKKSELEALSSSRILELKETCRPRSPKKIGRQEVFLTEDPVCLSVA
jgi:hypothetical protein